MEIEGTILSKIYEGVNGYTVIEVDTGEPTIVVGNLPNVNTGECTRFFGDYKTHQKYGRQFVATSYESALPKNLEDVILFLSGGFIKGLGEVLATRIVESFGETTFDIIENRYLQLSEVKGVSKKLALNIHTSFLEYSQKKYVYADLIGMGLSASQANGCVEKYGDNALACVKKNPYVLIELQGIDFATVDMIALKAGVEKDNPMRIRTAVFNVLKKDVARGNTYARYDVLISHISRKIGVVEKLVKNEILSMAFDKEIVLKKYKKYIKGVFLNAAYYAQKNSAAKLFVLAKGKSYTLPKIVKSKELQLTEEQSNAVETALTNKVCIITGGPGTGKTTILKAVLASFYAQAKTCTLAAPTGRAAKRMQETCLVPAQTIHRLLEYSHDEDDFSCYFRRNEKNPLEEDVVIIDEVSMIDIFLFNNLLKALNRHTTLVLVGDENQLNSVGAGNVMSDIIASGAIKTIKLTHKFRNAGDIAQAAYSVLNGEMPRFDSENIVFFDCMGEEGIIKKVGELYCKYKDKDIQVLCPIKKKNGVNSFKLNNSLRERLNPLTLNKKQIIYGDSIFREGDRVMQIKNNYGREYTNSQELTKDEGVFNGDLGEIIDINAGVVTVLFEDMKLSEYVVNDLKELESAYCYTIHKSQGSEFDVVILALYFDVSPFYARNLLYTAITRAKTRVYIVGSKSCLAYMIDNMNSSKRTSILDRELSLFGRFLQ